MVHIHSHILTAIEKFVPKVRGLHESKVNDMQQHKFRSIITHSIYTSYYYYTYTERERERLCIYYLA
jgi:hypothetical protein